MKSILQDEKVCYITKMEDQPYSLYGKLDKHHIFFGSGDRPVSEKHGFWIWLRHDHHIEDSKFDTPHNCEALDDMLKRTCQAKYEETHSRAEFMKLIGRNYLE